MVERQLPKLKTRVRFPSSAPRTKAQVRSHALRNWGFVTSGVSTACGGTAGNVVRVSIVRVFATSKPIFAWTLRQNGSPWAVGFEVLDGTLVVSRGCWEQVT